MNVAKGASPSRQIIGVQVPWGHLPEAAVIDAVTLERPIECFGNGYALEDGCNDRGGAVYTDTGENKSADQFEPPYISKDPYI